ncbi:MAG: hypothetical protein ACXW27_18140 [Allosphingosinicella sp.]
MKVRFTEEALRDLGEIAGFLAKNTRRLRLPSSSESIQSSLGSPAGRKAPVAPAAVPESM